MTIIAGDIPTPEGRAALQSAIAEAKHRGAPLVVVQETPMTKSTAPGFLETLQHAHPQVEVTVRGCSADQGLTESILLAAEEEAADLIVVGIRKRSKVGKLNLGSNVQKLLLQSPCEVLAVKGELPNRAKSRPQWGI